MCHAFLNIFSTKINALLNSISAVWHIVGVVVCIIVLPAVAPSHQSAKYVFTDFEGTATNAGDIGNNGELLSLTACVWTTHCAHSRLTNAAMYASQSCTCLSKTGVRTLSAAC